MSWPNVELGEIFDIARGGSPRPIDDYITDASDGVNWISIKDASNSSKYITTTAKKIRRSGVSRSREVKPGDFLLTNSMSFGRPYILRTSGCIHDGWLVLRGDESVINQDYFYHLLGSDLVYRKFQSLAAGAVVKNLNIDLVKTVKVPLPPLTEQRRIAAVLDKADALRAKRREAIVKLDQLLQSVFLDMFGDPATNPKRLPIATLGDLGEWRSGGTPSRSNPNSFHGHIPWYSSGELNSPYVRISNEHISDTAVAASAAKLMKPGSLMVGMYDTAAFKSSITTIPATCNQAVAFSHLDASKCETVYVYQALQVGKEHFKRLQRGVRQKNLNLSMIRETTIPLPPVGLQRKFATMFAAVLSQIDKQGGQAESMDVFFRAIQRWAFQGTL